MNKTVFHYSWSILVALFLSAIGSHAAILPAEQQILQRAGLNVSNIPEWRFDFNDEGHITAVRLDNYQLTTLPLALLELPYVERIDLQENQIAGDIGALVDSYRQTAPTLGQHVQTFIVRKNLLTGDIGPLVAMLDALPEIHEINANENRISQISVMPQTEELRVWVQEQSLTDLSVTFNPDTQTPAELMALLPSITLYNPWDRVMNEYESIHCYIDDEHEMDIHESGDGFSVWTREGLRFSNGHTFKARCGNICDFNVSVRFTVGDVNFSGTIDEDDVDATYDFIGDGLRAWSYNFTAGDLNGDNDVNVLDLMKLYHQVAGTTPQATSGVGTNTLSTGDLLFNSEEKLLPVMVSNDNTITALQFDIVVPVGMWINCYDSDINEERVCDNFRLAFHSISDENGLRTYRLLLWSQSGEPLLRGKTGQLLQLRLQRDIDIALANYKMRVEQACFATSDSRNVFTSATTGTLNFNMDADDEEYNILLQTDIRRADGTALWDLSGGPSAVKNLRGITMEDGHVAIINLNHQNLTGHFPFILTTLPYLRELRVSANQLSGDIGTQAEAFRQTNPTVSSRLEKIDIDENEFSGNIGPMLSLYPTLTHFWAGNNHLTDISPLPDRSFSNISLNDQRLDDVLVEVNTEQMSTRDVISQLPPIVLFNSSNNTLDTDIHFYCTKEGENVLDIRTNGDQWQFWTDGSFLANDDTYDTRGGNGQFRLRYHFREGDADGNGQVNADDVKRLADCLGQNDFNGWDKCNVAACDLNHDSQADALDLVRLISMVTPGTTTPPVAQPANVITMPDQRFHQREIIVPILLNNTDGITAMQFDLRVPYYINVYGQELSADRKADHQLSVRYLRQEKQEYIYRILVYSPTNTPLRGTAGTVATLRMVRNDQVDAIYAQAAIEHAVLSTNGGVNVLTATSPATFDFTSLPKLTVTASKTTVIEGETLQLTVSTDHANAQALPVTIQSEDNHRFDVSMQALIPAGQTSVTIEVKTLEDDIPQLDQPNLFTVSAPEHDNGEVLVLLKDNDVPELSLTFDVTEVNELDGDGAVTATLKRTKKTNNKITVLISDDANGRLTYAQNTIEMAKNVDEVTFHLGPVDNDAEDGDQTYHITAAIYVASCDCAVGGESAGSVQATLRVLDDDGSGGHQPSRKLADAVVSSVTTDVSEVEVGSAVIFSITVKNQGTDVLPATNVNLYNATTGENEAILRTKGAMAVGASETLTRKVFFTRVGQQQFYAVVNETEEVSELRYANNESQKTAVKVLSPWTATITTDKKVYMQKDTVRISGQLSGRDIARASVDIYMLNEGCREVTTVVTDDQGAFFFNWAPYEYQSGHVVIGACYPGEDCNEAMAAVDIYGLRRADRSQISNMVTVGEACRGNIMLQNPGVLALSGIKAQVMDAPDNCKAELTVPATIAADGEVPLQFSLLASAPSPEKKWQQVKVLITSKEGASLPLTLYYYAQYAQAQLVAVDGDIHTTMTKGQPREYPFVITNNGKGSTGKMTLSLPSCIRSATGNTLSALAPGDTTTVMLQFVPVDAMQLNVPYKGMLAVTPEQGNGLSVNFSVTPVSNEKGTLVVDVTDELTYYTDEAPHVAGAEVVLRNPVTEALVAQGTTDADGRLSFTLPEGYYQLNVTADKHNSYQNNILVDPGVTTEQEVCLTYQAVTVTWTVVETEVEDEYQVVSTLDFEARVPVPVVQLNTVPERIGIDHLAQGESLIYHSVLTNKGLITAQDVCLYLPDDDVYFKWEPLAEYEHFDLPAQQTYIIPVRVTRVGGPTAGDAASRSRRAEGMSMPCSINERVKLEWPCGDDMHAASVSVCLYYKGECGGEGTGGLTPWGDPTGGGFGSAGTEGEEGGGISLGGSCNLCLLKMLGVFGDCFMGVFGKALPGLGCLLSMVNCGSELADGKITADDIADCGLGAAGCIVEAFCMECKLANGLLSLVQCIKSAKDLKECMSGSNGSNGGSAPDPNGSGSDGDSGDNGKPVVVTARRASVMPSFQEDYMQVMDMLLQVTEASMNQWHEYFGDSIWFNNITQEQFRQTLDIILRQPSGSAFTADQFLECKPDEVSATQLARFVERLNNTRRFEQTAERSENMMDMDNIQRIRNTINDVEFFAIARGYESATEMFQRETDLFIQRASEEEPGVCATIKLQITQRMTLTRQAFRGTLTIQNGSENTDMEDIKLRLKVASSYGEMATAKEFEIHVESLDGFEGTADFDSGWSLQKGATGTATIVFIPSKYAAPLKPVDYSFGGTLSYTDPVSGTRITRELFPVTLTVKPSPELDLTYFMQRDILGDDALTEDVVEPMIPAEFTVVINNKGYGDAANVRMVTEQPKIIENDKGLYIDFEILSSQLNGEDKVMAMGQNVATEFGTIPAHSQSYATWELQSTLLGHFVTYNIEATHVTSYGNPDLSLLDQVTIHELIHGFTPTAGSVSSGFVAGRAFLVNDELDADDTPDAVYFSNAAQPQPVVVAASAAATATERPYEYLLHVTPAREGWTYGSVEDPTDGRAKLISIVRQSDRQQLPVDNFWQTDRTLRDAKAPLYEKRLHFVGEMSAGGEDYLLTFEPLPDVQLAVELYPDLPAEESVITEPLRQLTVRFNKPILAETFTAQDIKLCRQGVPIDISNLTITKISDTDYRFNLQPYTLQSGYYVLTVQTADITDHEGFLGYLGKQATWIQLLGDIEAIEPPKPIDEETVRQGYPATHYDIGGRPVDSRAKGMHITRGKKHVVK
ncbi:MAG: hypothetical protein IJ546_08020 [Prevotella sp.]|nr:hypothetical protein [Prevotella sp.]